MFGCSLMDLLHRWGGSLCREGAALVPALLGVTKSPDLPASDIDPAAGEHTICSRTPPPHVLLRLVLVLMERPSDPEVTMPV